MSTDSKLIPKRPKAEKPRIIGNTDELAKTPQFRALLGSYLPEGDPNTPTPANVPWVPGLSLHYWKVEQPGEDTQSAHFQDEIYYIIKGSGQIILGEEKKDFIKGDLIFVPANVFHRFCEYTDDLEVLIIFGPDWDGREAWTGSQDACRQHGSA